MRKEDLKNFGLLTAVVMFFVWAFLQMTGCNCIAGAGKMIEGAGMDLRQAAETHTPERFAQH